MIKLKKSYTFTCDDCGYISFFDSFSHARQKRWAIARDSKKCYCELCAKYHRHVGNVGAPERTQFDILRERMIF